MKWIAAAAVVAVAVLLFLLREVTSERGADPATPGAAARSDAAPRAVTAAAADAAPAAADGAPGVLAVRSEEFWDRVDSYARQLMSYVADCYQGGKDRKAKLKVTYQLSISNHQVRLRDVRIVDTTLGDEVLEGCMVRSLEGAAFVDKEMPDFLSNHDDPEELLIRIEGLKRFLPEQDDGAP